MAGTMRAVEHTKLGTAVRDNRMMREAIELAADGELGNSDAIRLLQIPHYPEDVRAILHTFDAHLSPEAKSKLTLDALVPRSDTVDNQRYEPIFDKYLITGETYTTASGVVVPNQLQYYNGEMVHLYGECANVESVNNSLAGSGYRPITLEYTDGRQTAVAQLWSTRFTDSSIGPYSAMFIVVVVVRNDTPASQASIRADANNNASSVLVMLNGALDQTTAVYENKARLFMVRLLDTTRVAIEVGRERMGTDKRPGTLDMTRDGRHLRLSIKDEGGRGVVRGDLDLAGDPAMYLPEVAKAAATAGIPFRSFPRGTEYCYPAVARIGQGPIVSWQWRSDLLPRLQSLMPDAIVVDSDSEEGRILRAWGFRPTVLGYIPNVRGVITGLAPGQSVQRPKTAADVGTPFPRLPTIPGGGAYGEANNLPDTGRLSMRFPWSERDPLSPLPEAGWRPDADRGPLNAGGIAVNQRTRDGSVLSWGTADAPSPPFVADPGASVPVTVAVSPIRPGHVVTVDYRLNGGPLRQVTALPDPRAQGANARLFRAAIPGQNSGLVEFLPVLRLAGQPVSPRLGESGEPLRYEVRGPAEPVQATRSNASGVAVPSGQPHWAWDPTFLGSLTAFLRKEVVGVTPDGLRIDWHVTEGSFVGAGLDMVMRPGAADWMRIRKDGIGIMSVQACLEARTGGQRIYASYGGMVDFGPRGYDRALRDEYEQLLPVVVTPTYATADRDLDWLNRAQCIGVGMIDTSALRVDFDVYVVRVGGQADGEHNAENRIIRSPVSPAASLYKRLGGYDVLAAVADDFIARIMADKQLGRFFVGGYTEASIQGIRQQVVNLLCELTGGSCFYRGRDMRAVHKGFGITDADWKIAVDILIAALTRHQVAPQEQSEFMQIIESTKGMIVENPDKRAR